MHTQEECKQLESEALKRAVSINELASVIENHLSQQISRPNLIHIAGASCSGKTTCAQKLNLLNGATIHFSMDNYMKGQKFVDKLLVHDPQSYGWDDPRNLDLETIQKDLTLLRNSFTINMPIFNRSTNEREPRSYQQLFATAGDNVVVEGIHAMSPIISGAADVKVFIYASLHDRLWRRAVRNTLSVNHSSNNLDFLLQNYLLRVEPSFQKHVRGHIAEAHIVVNNPGEPSNEFEQFLIKASDVNLRDKYFGVLIPHPDIGDLKANEKIVLSIVEGCEKDNIMLHYIVGNRELLRHTITEETFSVLKKHYEIKSAT